MKINFWIGDKVRVRAVESTDYDDESDRFCDEIHFPSSYAIIVARV